MRSPSFLVLVLVVPLAFAAAVAITALRPHPAEPAPAPAAPASPPAGIPASLMPPSPPASAGRPATAGTPRPWHGPDMNQVARDMGMPVYPGAQGGGGGWGGGRGTVTGHVDFTTSASYEQVLAFYKQQCQSKLPTIDTVRKSNLAKAILVWEEGKIGRAVVVAQSPPPLRALGPVMSTRITLAAAALPVESTALRQQAPVRRPVPETLGLPVFPGAQADYAGQLTEGSTPFAAARLRVVTTSPQLTGYYSGSASSTSRSGNQTIEYVVYSRGCSVSILHPDADLPAIVWLVKR